MSLFGVSCLVLGFASSGPAFSDPDAVFPWIVWVDGIVVFGWVVRFLGWVWFDGIWCVVFWFDQACWVGGVFGFRVKYPGFSS